jgi:hypothetical protein
MTLARSILSLALLAMPGVTANGPVRASSGIVRLFHVFHDFFGPTFDETKKAIESVIYSLPAGSKNSRLFRILMSLCFLSEADDGFNSIIHSSMFHISSLPSQRADATDHVYSVNLSSDVPTARTVLVLPPFTILTHILLLFTAERTAYSC